MTFKIDKSMFNSFSKMEKKKVKISKINHLHLQQILYFGDYTINYIIKISNTTNKILFFSPKYLNSSIFIGVIQQKLFLSYVIIF